MLFHGALFLQTVSKRLAVALNKFCVSGASKAGRVVS